LPTLDTLPSHFCHLSKSHVSLTSCPPLTHFRHTSVSHFCPTLLSHFFLTLDTLPSHFCHTLLSHTSVSHFRLSGQLQHAGPQALARGHHATREYCVLSHHNRRRTNPVLPIHELRHPSHGSKRCGRLDGHRCQGA